MPFVTVPGYPGYPVIRYIDAPICRDENLNADDDCTDASADRRLYYLTDANMNVTALADDSGAVVERYIYDAYGARTVLNGASDADSGVTDWSTDADNASDYDNAIGFGGYYRDSETGLYHVRFRMYHPALGTWLQRDPLGYVDGMGLHGYVGSSPVNGTDRFGLAAISLGLPSYSPGTWVYHPAPVAGAAGAAGAAASASASVVVGGALVVGTALTVGLDCGISAHNGEPNAIQLTNQIHDMGVSWWDVLVYGGEGVVPVGSGVRPTPGRRPYPSQKPVPSRKPLETPPSPSEQQQPPSREPLDVEDGGLTGDDPSKQGPLNADTWWKKMLPWFWLVPLGDDDDNPQTVKSPTVVSN